MATAETTRNFIQLDVSNVGGRVTVTPPSGDRFVLRMDEAISACMASQSPNVAEHDRTRFRILLDKLGAWVVTRKDVRDAFLTARDGKFAFVVVQAGKEYDRDLEDALSALDFDIANDHDIRFCVEVMALPNAPERSLRAFLMDGATLRFAGGERT